MSRAVSRHCRPRCFVCALASLAFVWCIASPGRTETTLSLKLHIRPDALVHFLADFTNEPAMDDRVVSWSLVEESRAGGVWQYLVHYEAGTGVWGEVRVRLTQENMITHTRRHCHVHPILRNVCWKEECVVRVGGGDGLVAEYWEECAVQCGWGSCGGHGQRREARADKMVALLRAKGMLTQ